MGNTDLQFQDFFYFNPELKFFQGSYWT